MATKGRIQLDEIFEMLKKCAPGHEVLAGPHHYRVKWKGVIYPTLPKGEHGKKEGRAEIQTGHVRHLARFFSIEDCAKALLEALR